MTPESPLQPKANVCVCGKPANAQVHLGVELIQPCGPTEGPQAGREDRASHIHVVAIGAAKEHASGSGFALQVEPDHSIALQVV